MTINSVNKWVELTTSQGAKKTKINELISVLNSVLDKDLITPPTSPAKGDRYIVAIGGTDAWLSHDGDLAEWQTDVYGDSAWVFTTPFFPMLQYVVDEGVFYYYNGTTWGILVGTAGSDTTAIHDDTAAEISAIAEKTTPVAADLLVMEDSAAANVKKKVQVGNLPYTTTLAHSALTSVTTAQHHTKYTDAEALLAAPAETQATVEALGIAHTSLTSVGASDHHAKTISSEIDHVGIVNNGIKTHAQIDSHIGDASAHHTKTVSSEIDHSGITGVATSQHHTKYTDANAVAAIDAVGYLKTDGSISASYLDIVAAGYLSFRTRADLGIFESAFSQNIATPNNTIISIDSNNNTTTSYFGVTHDENVFTPTNMLFKVVEDKIFHYVETSLTKMSLNTAPIIPGASTEVNLGLGNSGSLKIYTAYGYLEVGAQNTSWAHFVTDRANFYFNKVIQAVGGFKAYGTGATINEFSTDGTLAGNSDTAVPTEKAVRTYVNSAVGLNYISESTTLGANTYYNYTWKNIEDWGFYASDTAAFYSHHTTPSGTASVKNVAGGYGRELASITTSITSGKYCEFTISWLSPATSSGYVLSVPVYRNRSANLGGYWDFRMYLNTTQILAQEIGSDAGHQSYSWVVYAANLGSITASTVYTLRLRLYCKGSVSSFNMKIIIPHCSIFANY